VESLLGPLGTSTTEWPILPAPGDYDDGEFGGMNIGRGNRSTRIKPAPVPLCPPQIPLDQTRARTRATAVGSQRLTAWAMTQPFCHYLWVQTPEWRQWNFFSAVFFCWQNKTCQLIFPNISIYEGRIMQAHRLVQAKRIVLLVIGFSTLFPAIYGTGRSLLTCFWSGRSIYVLIRDLENHWNFTLRGS
jgi:hypothetical protein